ncbi:MAG: bL35 family ribosomal protein [Brevefilum sp.]|jgi:large subunit ribosomal protein L35|nr:50S ribosomal protein L35 [Brevefilum sp.]MDT8382035.1 bL35 family ribosomal protein [Brevefilum sp.]MDW7754330.1 bL35 family ribosomal protein [Brevefilum sp.]HAF49046.1 50S ribosomal protein L35 [Anaerolineaceae bacterium]
MPRKQKDGKFKMKTHKATSKRFKMTGSGKIMRTKIGKGHLRRRTPDRTKMLFERMIPVKTRSLKKTVKRLAPYMDKNK